MIIRNLFPKSLNVEQENDLEAKKREPSGMTTRAATSVELTRGRVVLTPAEVNEQLSQLSEIRKCLMITGQLVGFISETITATSNGK